jgi:hypothetical protein
MSAHLQFQAAYPASQSTYVLQKLLPKAMPELRAVNRPKAPSAQRRITVGHCVEGVCQAFTLHCKSTVRYPHSRRRCNRLHLIFSQML